MDDPIKPSELAATVGISMSYASEIVSAKRAPSRTLSLSIFHSTGRRFGPLIGLSDEDIATLARIEATRPSNQAAAA